MRPAQLDEPVGRRLVHDGMRVPEQSRHGGERRAPTRPAERTDRHAHDVRNRVVQEELGVAQVGRPAEHRP